MIYKVVYAVVFLLLLSLVMLFVRSRIYKWDTVSAVMNDDYEVAVKAQSCDATTLPVLKITCRKTSGILANARTLVRLIGYRSGSCEMLSDNILLMSASWNPDDYHKLYFLANLDKLPYGTFELWPDDKWRDGETLWSDSSGSHKFALHTLEEPTHDFYLSCDGYPLRFDMFVLAAKNASARLQEPDLLSLDIEWKSGKRTENLLLKMPEQPTGFVKAKQVEITD